VTAFFIKEMHATLKCGACKKLPVDGKKFCPKHLAVARNRWRRWSVERRKEGLCCYCHRKSYKGFLRCRIHTQINREKCRDWMARHPERSAVDWQKRKKWIDLGRCPMCRPHRKLPTGFRRCNPCRKRQRSYSK
jgi:hypothetical protein